jgi:cellulose synthase/poly-beta-1,6-N-acetylglucosamine synthase-like glycosyltransferase
MLVSQALRWLLLAAEVGIACPVLYLCILSFSAVLDTKKRRAEDIHASSRTHIDFGILIPAHDEELVITTLLESLALLEYPKEKYTVYVVADNCTDGTAELASRTCGVRLYERFDQARRGKGYALNWLLQKLEEDRLAHDAYIVLDADSIVAPTFLRVMEQGLAHNAQALQANNTVLNVADSPSTALRWIALTLINHVRPLGRNGVGGSSTLTGNGMCLTRALLLRYPWKAFSAGEDYQYYLTLVGHGERVRYVPEAVVRSCMPTTFAQMRTQDIRWESLAGSPTKWWQVTLSLLGDGLKHHDFVRIEAVAELLTPPLSFLIFSCLLTFTASLVLWSLPGFLLSLALISGLICYVGTALYLLRPPWTVYRALLHAPGFIAWKLWVYLVLGRSKKHTSEWVRTSRTVS